MPKDEKVHLCALWLTVPYAPVTYVNGGKSVALPSILCVCVWPCHLTFRILVPLPGIKPRPTAVKALSLNHWTAKEFLPLCS